MLGIFGYLIKINANYDTEQNTVSNIVQGSQ